jgi:antirestriction protein ArdC
VFLALWMAAEKAGYSDGLGDTYRRWQNAGAQVRKGERSTTVVLWKEVN